MEEKESSINNKNDIEIGKYERDWWIESWWRFNYVERCVDGEFGVLFFLHESKDAVMNGK